MRRHNPLRARLHATYTAREIAELFEVNIRAVRDWTTKGLCPIDRQVPHLFHGTELREFVRKLNKPHEPLGAGEFFCVCCKDKRLPAHGEVWLTPRSEKTADYTARCADCGRMLFRRVRLAEVQLYLGSARLIHEDESAHVSTNSEAPRTAPLEEYVA